MKKIKIALLAVATMLLTISTISMTVSLVSPKTGIESAKQDLRVFTKMELKEYAGNRPNTPIYIAYNGLVYDVTPGRKFYESGGVYHFLAGRDSTVELNIAGGGIIKRKYKVVGRLVD